MTEEYVKISLDRYDTLKKKSEVESVDLKTIIARMIILLSEKLPENEIHDFFTRSGYIVNYKDLKSGRTSTVGKGFKHIEL